jgi:hypothetical protein
LEGFAENSSSFFASLSFLPPGFSSFSHGLFRHWFLLILEPMKPSHKRCKCLNCKELFLPNCRCRGRQRFCSTPDCQKASKQASQKAWLQKPENQNHFRDPHHAARVRQWQKDHPGYWKNTARARRRTLQEACSTQPVAPEASDPNPPARTLQDLCSVQTPLFVGLISMLAGCTLQENIALTTRRLIAKGYDILGMVPGMNLERSAHEKTCSLSGTAPEGASPVQLDRSSPGAGKLFHPV